MRNYLMLIIAVLLQAVDFVFNKMYQKRSGSSLSAGLRFNAWIGLFTAIVFFIIHGILEGFSFPVTWFSVVMAAAMATFNLSYVLLGFQMLSAGKMATYTLFLMTGGMMVPYVWGLFVLDEKFSLLRTAGLIVLILGVFLSNYQKGGLDKRYILLGVGVFLLNGAVSTVSKMHQVETTFAAVTSTAFVMWVGITKMLLCAAALLFLRKKPVPSGQIAPAPFRSVFYIFLGCALVGGISYLLQLIGAQNLPATILYPFITGGCIIVTALAGWLLYHEKLSKQTILGIALCFAGTCMFL